MHENLRTELFVQPAQEVVCITDSVKTKRGRTSDCT